jgi:hypothetical protein
MSQEEKGFGSGRAGRKPRLRPPRLPLAGRRVDIRELGRAEGSKESARRVQGECKESARRVQGECKESESSVLCSSFVLLIFLRWPIIHASCGFMRAQPLVYINGPRTAVILLLLLLFHERDQNHHTRAQ